ncbi:hypothetical protein LXL04_024849 [Taraxacum kok-saghyz]
MRFRFERYSFKIMASQEHDRETAGDQPPLWGYVTKLEKLSGTGGGWSFKCNFCSEEQVDSKSCSRLGLHPQQSPTFVKDSE